MAMQHDKSMQHITLSGCDRISDVGISWLASTCHAITRLDIAWCNKITDIGLRSIGESFLHLTYLDATNCGRISDVGLRYIATGCKEITTLILKGNILISDGCAGREFGPEGLSAVSIACSNIAHIDLSKCLRVGDVSSNQKNISL